MMDPPLYFGNFVDRFDLTSSNSGMKFWNFDVSIHCLGSSLKYHVETWNIFARIEIMVLVRFHVKYALDRNVALTQMMSNRKKTAVMRKNLFNKFW